MSEFRLPKGRYCGCRITVETRSEIFWDDEDSHASCNTISNSSFRDDFRDAMPQAECLRNLIVSNESFRCAVVNAIRLAAGRLDLPPLNGADDSSGINSIHKMAEVVGGEFDSGEFPSIDQENSEPEETE